MSDAIHQAQGDLTHVFTPQFEVDAQGKFAFSLRHHVQGEPARSDRVYAVGTFATQHEGRAETVAFAHRYIAEHDGQA